MLEPPSIEALGDRGVLLRFGERIDAELNAQVHALARRLSGWPELIDAVPAYASIALHLAPGIWFDEALLTRLQGAVQSSSQVDQRLQPGAIRSVSVRFDGLDLASVATALELTQAELIARLCAPLYQVAMLGFLPGFPYLLGLDATLALPRRAQPRARVPANSLALGGAQLGVYPCACPGGWHLLGSLTEILFDPRRDPPSLLNPGDRLRIEPA